MDWYEARDNCKRLGGDLLVIHSKEVEQKAMKGANDHWIGLQSPQRNGVYQWVDGSKPTYTNWGPFKPSPDSDGCVIITYGGRWYTMLCVAELSSICEI